MYYLGSPESDFGYERILRAEEQDLSSFGRGARMRARLRRASPRTQRRRQERARSAAQRRAQLRVARRAATSQTNLEQSRRRWRAQLHPAVLARWRQRGHGTGGAGNWGEDQIRLNQYTQPLQRFNLSPLTKTDYSESRDSVASDMSSKFNCILILVVRSIVCAAVLPRLAWRYVVHGEYDRLNEEAADEARDADTEGTNYDSDEDYWGPPTPLQTIGEMIGRGSRSVV